MAVHNITPDDLRVLKQDLLNEIDRMLRQWQTGAAPRALGATGEARQQYVKTHEILELLKVSPNTLQAMRDEGRLPYIKIGHLIYYDLADVEKMLEVKPRPRPRKIKKCNNNQQGS